MNFLNKNNIKVFNCIKVASKSNNPFIYLKQNISAFEAVPLNNLFGVICDLADSSIYSYGIPPELIRKIDMSLDAPIIKHTHDKSVVYFSPSGYDNKENVLNIIKLFNLLSSKNLTIYTTKDIYKSVNGFSNENIKFVCYTHPNEIIISTSAIITFGYYSRAFIKQKIPTIIIGPYGLGGWVTPDNFDYLFRENFKGRVGGNYNEIIPLAILVDEFMEIDENKNLDKLLRKNAALLKLKLNKVLINEIDSVIDNFKNTCNNFYDSTQRFFLKPKLASNITLRKNKETTFIQRNILNDVLFSLPESDIELLNDLNSAMTCKDLQKKYELTSDEFWNILIPLWERKAITFSL